MEIRELLLAGEEVVRSEWHELRDEGAPAEQIARGTAASSALDRITQIGAAVLEQGHGETLALVVESFLHLYRDAELEGAAEGRQTVDDALAARRRRDITVRVYTLGALAVYQRAFEFVRPLVLQRPDDRTHRRLWLRETVTSLARSDQFQRKTLIPLVGDYAADHVVLYRRFRNRKDDLVNALCQFDFLQCTVATVETSDIHNCYPNFGAYFNERTEPVVVSLVKKGPARAVVPSVDDVTLASLIHELDNLAGELFFSYAGWERNDWQSESLKKFLRENLVQTR